MHLHCPQPWPEATLLSCYNPAGVPVRWHCCSGQQVADRGGLLWSGLGHSPPLTGQRPHLPVLGQQGSHEPRTTHTQPCAGATEPPRMSSEQSSSLPLGGSVGPLHHRDAALPASPSDAASLCLLGQPPHVSPSRTRQ